MDEIIELKQLYAQSFDDSEGFREYFFRNLTSLEKTVRLKEDGRIASALHLLDRKMFLRDVIFDMPFVVAAATVEERRGQRLLEKVMSAAFARLCSEDKAFVALYPFKHSYYKKYGFVSFSKATQTVLNFFPSDDVEITVATAEDMLRVYNRYCVGKHGYILRNVETFNELIRRWSVDGLQTVLVKKNKKTEAYVVFSELGIEEACGEISLLCAVRELNGKIVTDFDGNENEFAMVRLLNPQKVAEKITFDADGEISFLLKDTFLPSNDGAYKITVFNGRGKWENIEPNDELSVLSIEQLTLWFFGQGGFENGMLLPTKTFCIDKY